MSAEALVEDIINQALETGQQKATEAASYASQAASASSGSISMPYSPIAFTAASVEPVVHIPFSAAGVDPALFNSTYGKIFTDLTNSFADFFAQYFPDECDYISKAQQWMCDVLDGNASGLSPVVEDQIWQRERARLLREAARAEDEILSTFASRGFPLPPGAAAHQASQVQQRLQEQVSDSSRARAIQQAELQIENIRFVVTNALEYRVKGIQAAADYIKVLALGPEIAMRLATSAADAQARLITAASTFYNARIRLEEMKLHVVQFNKETQQGAATTDVQEFSRRLNARVQTLSAAARAAGDQASAALNAVHASAQIAVQGEAE